RLLEADHFAPAVGCLQLQLVDRREAAVPLEYAHLALSGEAGQAAGKPRHHAVLPGAQLVQVDGRLDEVESAAFRHFAGLRQDLRRVQQGFGRDTANVETHTTQHLPAVDEYHLFAQVGGTERSGVTAGPGAEHEYLGVHIALG